MGSKLKKKRHFRPKGYEDRNKMQQIERNKSLSENSFNELFESLQLINLTVLYAPKEENGFDFNREQLNCFNRAIKEFNESYEDNGPTYLEVMKSHMDTYEFDCTKEAVNFPYRPKLKMYGKSFRNMNEHEIILISINGAIETYLVLALHVLRDIFHFSREDILIWWNKFKEISELYVDGMTDEFIMKYLKDECGMKIK